MESDSDENDASAESEINQRGQKCPVPLKVAMKFPPRRSERRKGGMEPVPETPMPTLDSDSDTEENGAVFLERRALNIKENKAMASTLCLPVDWLFFPPSLSTPGGPLFKFTVMGIM